MSEYKLCLRHKYEEGLGDYMTRTYESVIAKWMSKKNILFLAGSLAILVIVATVLYGYAVLVMTAVSLIAAFLVELMFVKGRKLPWDMAWMIYPLLFVLLVPTNLELKYFWMVAVGSAFGSFFGKGLFGGSGKYVFNPAMVGILFITVTFPVHFPTTLLPVTTVGNYSILQLMLGQAPGTYGETFRLGILILGIALMALRVIDWKLVVSTLGFVFVLAFLGSLLDKGAFPNATLTLFAGNILLLSVFVVSDETTAPLSARGRILYGFGIALITVLIRYLGGGAQLLGQMEGTVYAIVIMSAIAPLIDKMFSKSNVKKEVETNEQES